MLIPLICERNLTDWSGLNNLVRKVLTKRCNILRDSSKLDWNKVGLKDKAWTQQDTFRLHRISIRKETSHWQQNISTMGHIIMESDGRQ